MLGDSNDMRGPRQTMQIPFFAAFNIFIQHFFARPKIHVRKTETLKFKAPKSDGQTLSFIQSINSAVRNVILLVHCPCPVQPTQYGWRSENGVKDFRLNEFHDTVKFMEKYQG